MKILTVVGIRKSGKTSTVTALVEEIRRRGMTVGTCKSVFCPTFSIDSPDSNTAKHLKAGANAVCARGKQETSLIYPRQMALTEILKAYQHFDYVLLEGDYLAPVPRLVAAHAAADALPRTNEWTLAYVGRISEKKEIELPLPRFNPLTEAAALLDFLEEHLEEISITSALDENLPSVAGVTGDGFCQCGCHKNEKKLEAKKTPVGVQALVDGKVLQLSEKQQALLRSWAEQVKA